LNWLRVFFPKVDAIFRTMAPRKRRLRGEAIFALRNCFN